MMGKGEGEGRREGEKEGGRRDIQLSNREAKYCNLFRHNRLNRLQREEYSVLEASLPPVLHTSSVMRRSNAQTRVQKKKKKAGGAAAGNSTSEVLLGSHWEREARPSGDNGRSNEVVGMGNEGGALFYFAHHERHSCVLIQLKKNKRYVKGVFTVEESFGGFLRGSWRRLNEHWVTE